MFFGGGALLQGGLFLLYLALGGAQLVVLEQVEDARFQVAVAGMVLADGVLLRLVLRAQRAEPLAYLFIAALGAGQPHGDDFLVLHNVYLQCKSAPLVIASASCAGFIPSSGISPPDLLLRFLQFARGSQIIRTLRTHRTLVFNSPAVKPRCRSSRARGGLRAGTGC